MYTSKNIPQFTAMKKLLLKKSGFGLGGGSKEGKP